MITGRPIRLTLLAASPVYYQVPLYRRLAADPRFDFQAIFASNAGIRPFDGGYGREISWDEDLLSGYESVFLRKAAQNPIGGGPLALRDVDIVHHVSARPIDALWLHGYHFVTHVLASSRQRTLRRPVLIREDQTLVKHRPAWKRAVKRAVLNHVLFRGAYGLYVGSRSRDWLVHHGIPEERLFHVPYAVENDALRVRARELAPRRNELRQQFGVAPEGGPVILSVGRLIPEKQPELLLEAFRQVRESRRCTLVFAGSGPLETALREAVRRASVPDVVFAGFLNRSEVPAAYAAADIFALASRHDTWGIAVQEAMNFGLPLVLSSAVGASADLITADTGFTVSPYGAGELADALARLVADADLRRELGAGGLRAVESWTYDRAVEGLASAAMAAAARTVPKARP
jgi:glycosyltransferase involved in cell wall biosynthesis